MFPDILMLVLWWQWRLWRHQRQSCRRRNCLAKTSRELDRTSGDVLLGKAVIIPLSSCKCVCVRMYVCMSSYHTWPLEVSVHPHITTGRNTFRLTPCTYTPPPSIQKSRLSITFNSFFFLRPLPSSQPPSCLPILCTPLLSKAFPFVTFV